ncbi:MAG TPA: ECF transporter S component [Candidatus Atribacteria bacterium]|nr:ECF transporter S component [Candidatus Atribacteria bacterium]
MEQKKLVYGGALAGLSLVVSLLIHFPLIPQAPFLLYDPGDIPILVAGFKFGPGLGLLLTAMVAVLFALITGEGGPWGVLMHFLATGSYVVLAGFIYRRHRTKNGAITSLIVAPLFMAAIMVGANLLVTPLYLGVEREVVKGMLLPAIVPFNLLKGVINGAITLLVYKRISNFIEEPLYERHRATTRVRS